MSTIDLDNPPLEARPYVELYERTKKESEHWRLHAKMMAGAADTEKAEAAHWRAERDRLLAENERLRSRVAELEAPESHWECQRRIDYLEDNRRENGAIISKVNDAVNRAGIRCAIYYWEAIDQIAAERDTARAEVERMRTVTQQFRDALSRAERELSQRGRGGQHVPFHGDFCSAPPSALSHIARWVRAFECALSSTKGDE